MVLVVFGRCVGVAGVVGVCWGVLRGGDGTFVEVFGRRMMWVVVLVVGVCLVS